MRPSIVFVIVYSLKFRVIVWRAARCLRPCGTLSSPLSVMPSQLRVRRNETKNSYCYSLLVKFKSDGVKRYKMSEALR